MNVIKHKLAMIQGYDDKDRGHKMLMSLLDLIRSYCGNLTFIS